MLKKILTFILTTGLFAGISASSNSCAPTAPSEKAVALLSAPSSLALDTTNPTGSSSIALSCSCPFPLTVTGYGGDTNIHFSFNELLDAMITTHTLSVKFLPSSPHTGPNTTTAWIGVATPNDSVSPSNRGNLLYDTVRVTAVY